MSRKMNLAVRDADASNIPSAQYISRVEENIPSGSRASSFQQPPTFAVSEFETIIRKQKNNHPSGLKHLAIPSRYPNLDHQWEFAGWGSLTYLDLSPEELDAAQKRIFEKPPMVGQLRGTSLPGNSMTSSVFYAFPAVVAASSIFSPISLFIACLILFLWRPIFLELGSAIRLNGANYAYLLQVSGTTLGLVGAATTLLDSVATSTESAATAASYLRGEFNTSLSISETIITIILLTSLAILCLVNVRRSSTLTLGFFLIHMFVMFALMLASVVAWGRRGSSVLTENWNIRPQGASGVAKAIFNGVCVGFLGVTGFETTPTYIEAIRPDAYQHVLRNILVCTLALNAPLMLLVYAILPEKTITGGANILSVLAENVAGKWLRIIVVVDCVLVLSGGVIDGICSGCALLERLAKDQVFSEILLRQLPITGSQYISIIFCFALNLLLYSSSAFSLVTISGVFTVTFLFTLLLFVVSDLLLKFNRDRLPRQQRAGLFMVLLTLCLVIMLLVGNIVLEPKILGLFIIYFIATVSPLLVIRYKDSAANIMLWLYSQSGFRKFWWTSSWDLNMIAMIKAARRHSIYVWVGRDDIHDLMNLILYIRNNETTSHIVFVHAYLNIESIPGELVPNIKILDEAFPTVTMDLIFVQGPFGPALVEAVSANQSVPRSKMFVSSPGERHGWKLGDYQGVRVVARY